MSSLIDRSRNITLLAHVVAPNCVDDDTHAINEFLCETGLELESIFPTSLEELRAVLAGAELVIGSRMHACLNSLSVGTPAVAWAYSRKFAPLLNDLGWDYVVDLSARNSEPALETLVIVDTIDNEKFRRMTADVRQRASQRLADSLPALRQLSCIPEAG